tara:strand:+ start:247 stop:693 length:447 start_codon:yes stop_codon:yes gene_type:complete
MTKDQEIRRLKFLLRNAEATRDAYKQEAEAYAHDEKEAAIAVFKAKTYCEDRATRRAAEGRRYTWRKQVTHTLSVVVEAVRYHQQDDDSVGWFKMHWVTHPKGITTGELEEMNVYCHVGRALFPQERAAMWPEWEKMLRKQGYTCPMD